MVWKIGFIIGIICHLANKQECNLLDLVVGGENEDVSIVPLSSVTAVLQLILTTQHGLCFCDVLVMGQHVEYPAIILHVSGVV